MIEFTNRWPPGLTRRGWPLAAASALAVLVVLLVLDHRISVELSNQSQQVVDFFASVTRWGKSDWILYPSAALLAASALAAWLVPQRLPKLALIEMVHIFGFIFVGVGLPGLIANILKRLIGRGRPELFDSVGSLSFHPLANTFVYEGFPSGHTTTAFAFAMVIGFLAPRWFGLGLVYAIAIGASRLVLGVHYPTDVFAGLILGTLGAYAVRNYFASRRWGVERRADGSVHRRPAIAITRLLRRRQPSAAR